jgi:hypothetical protein
MTTASSLPARPESTAYMIAVTSRIFALDLGGLRRSLVRICGKNYTLGRCSER